MTALWAFVIRQGRLNYTRTTLGRSRPIPLDLVGLPTRATAAASPAVQATVSRRLAYATIVLGPLAFASFLLAVCCGGTLWDCLPVWHDEIWYFNEISVFAQAGWNGGYTVSHEWPARVDAVHFGPHGPLYPALYGMLARCTGMPSAFIPLLNAALLCLGGVVWVAVVRPATLAAWVCAFLVVTFWPLVLYIPTSMQEVLNVAMALVLSALAIRLIRQPESRGTLAGFLLATLLASQIRVTWSWLAVPGLWVCVRPQSLKQWCGMLGVAGLFVGGLYGEAILMYAPYPNFMQEVMKAAANAPLSALGMVIVHTLKNVVKYISPLKDTLLQVGFRYQTLLILGAVSVHLLRLRRAHHGTAAKAFESRELNQYSAMRRVDTAQPRVKEPSPRAATQPPAATAVFGFVLLNLACILGFVIAMYDVFDWRDYRVVAPHLLISLLILAACGAREWLAGYAILAALLGILAVPQFARFHGPRVNYDRAAIAAFGDQVERVITFQPGADPWDNTVLMGIDPLGSPMLTGLPSGIGATVVNYWERQAWPPRSKYLLLEKPLAEKLNAGQGFEKVAETALGDVFVRR